MTPKHLRQDLVNAYEGHDREAFDRALDRMAAMFQYTGPIPPAREQVLATEEHPVNNVTFAGSLHCMHPATCECKSWPQAKVCEHRRNG